MIHNQGHAYGLAHGGVGARFYGAVEDGNLGDTWLLNLQSWTWSPAAIDPAGAQPTAAEGAALEFVGDRGAVYRFGGYACTVNFVNSTQTYAQRKAPTCWLREFHSLDLATMSWTHIVSSSAAQLALTPSARSFSTMTYQQSTGILWITGGMFYGAFSQFRACFHSCILCFFAYLFLASVSRADVASGLNYEYNDLYAFDVNAGVWLPVNVYGTPKRALNGDTASLLGASILFFGGGDDPVWQFYNSFSQLLVGVPQLTAAAFQASGAGVATTLVGTTSAFSLTARLVGANGTFGAALRWATGQAALFSVNLVGSGPGGAPLFFPLSVVASASDAAVYECAYQVTTVAEYRLSVRFASVDIPGSPFRVVAAPASVYAPLISIAGTSAQQRTLLAVQGERNTATLLPVDRFSNALDAAAVNLSTVHVVVTATSPDGAIVAVEASISAVGNKVVLTWLAPELPTFSLSIKWFDTQTSNGTALLYSPYAVSAFASVEITTATRSAAFYLGGICVALVVACACALVVYREAAVVKAASVTMLAINLLGVLVFSIGCAVLVFECE